MEDVLIFAPVIMLLLVAGSSIVAIISQRRLTAIYKRSYEQAIERAEENGRQVNRALAAAEMWKENYNKMRTAFDELSHSFDTLSAANEQTVNVNKETQAVANRALEMCAEYRNMFGAGS